MKCILVFFHQHCLPLAVMMDLSCVKSLHVFVISTLATGDSRLSGSNLQSCPRTLSSQVSQVHIVQIFIALEHGTTID